MTAAQIKSDTTTNTPWKRYAQKFFVTGSCVVLEMTSGGLFMENVKMEKQRTGRPYPEIMRNIASQGLRGFQAGLVPWGLILGFTKGSVLGVSQARIYNGLKTNTAYSDSTAKLLSGIGAGAVQGVFMSPLLLARTRVNQALTERSLSKSGNKWTWGQEIKFSGSVLTNLIKDEGPMALTRGMGIFMVKRMYDWGTRFAILGMFREQMAKNKPNEKLSHLEKFASAFGAGALSVFLTIPVDRIAPVVQSAKSEAASGVVPYVIKMVKEQGIKSMFAGCVMRTIHTGYHTAFAIFLSETIMETFYKA